MEMLSRRAALRTGLASTAVVGGLAVGASEAHAAPLNAAAATGEGWISVLDHGALGDGTTDDTAAIQAALNAAVTSKKSVYFPAGRIYQVRNQLTAQGLSDVVISGHGATVALAGGPPSVKGQLAILRLQNCARVKLLGLTLHDTVRAHQYDGVRIVTSTGIVVDSVRVQSVRFNGIVVFDVTPRSSDDIVITNCTTEDTRFGISSNGRDVRITDNHVAMDWPSTEEARRYGGVHPGFGSDSDYFDGICVYAGADRTVIANNTVTEIGQSGIWVQAASNVVIADNTVFASQLHGIEIDGTADTAHSVHGRAVGIAITGNVVIDSVNGNINLVATTDATVVGNRVVNSKATYKATCIAVNLNSAKVTVTGNQVRQANPNLPAIFVKDNTTTEPNAIATEVTVAWNTVDAAIAYWAPTETVIIQRTGAGLISAQASLKTSGKVIAVGGLGIGNSVAATSVGSVVRKMEVFSSTGQSLGWIPIYNS
jgi:parallel beta-helix repeat protein